MTTIFKHKEQNTLFCRGVKNNYIPPWLICQLTSQTRANSPSQGHRDHREVFQDQQENSGAQNSRPHPELIHLND